MTTATSGRRKTSWFLELALESCTFWRSIHIHINHCRLLIIEVHKITLIVYLQSLYTFFRALLAHILLTSILRMYLRCFTYILSLTTTKGSQSRERHMALLGK